MNNKASEALDNLILNALEWDVTEWKEQYKLNFLYKINDIDYFLNIWGEYSPMGNILIIELRTQKLFVESVYVAGIVDSKEGIRELTQEEVWNIGI